MVLNFFRYAAAASAVLTVSNISYAQSVSTDLAKEQRVYLDAERLIEDRDNEQVIYEGNVVARFSGRTLRADRVIYDRKNNIVRAQGNVEIIDQDGQSRFADEIQVNEELGDGYALNFSSRLEGGAVATAAAAIHDSDEGNTLEQMAYTSCPVCVDDDSEPTWSIRAKRAVQNKKTEMISYQHAFLNIKGIPVVYVPYFAHPDPGSDRRSGFLQPTPGASSTTGLLYKQPYYWAISPSSELTIEPTFYQRVNPLVGLTYKKRFWSGYIHAEGAFAYDSDFDGDGEKLGDETWNSHIHANGQFQINNDWKWGFGTEVQSDDTYDRRYDIDGLRKDRGIFTGQTRSLLSQFYLQGQTETMYTEFGALRFQSLSSGIDPATTPLVLPTMFAEKNFELGDWKNIDLGTLAVSASTAIVQRDLGVSTRRVTTNANWRQRSILGPGLVVEPFAQIRGDIYDVEDTNNVYEEQTVSRSLGLAGVQASFPLTKRAGAFDLVIEPTAMAAWGSDNANDNGLPHEGILIDNGSGELIRDVEHTLRFEADESTLFNPNAAPLNNLWEGGQRLAIGVNAAARWGKDNSVTGVIGRRWRENDDAAFDQITNLSGTNSDYVAGAGLKFGRTLSLNTRLRLDEDSLNIKRIDARATLNYWRIKNSFQYFSLDESLKNSSRRRAELLCLSNDTTLDQAACVENELAQGDGEEGFSTRASFRMTKNWGLLASLDRNMTEEKNIRQTYGIYYQDDCATFELSYNREETRIGEIGPSESVNFRFSLRSLGNAGSSDFD